MAGLARAVEYQVGHRRGIQHRAGLGRAAQAGDATGGGGQGFAADIALAAVARLAQGDGQVDETGCGDQPLSLDALLRGEACRRLADGEDLAIRAIDVGDFVTAAGRVDQARAENFNGHQFCSSAAYSFSSWRCAVWPLMVMESTAMRTAMP